jgi:cation diffusion facilitator family transporter
MTDRHGHRHHSPDRHDEHEGHEGHEGSEGHGHDHADPGHGRAHRLRHLLTPHSHDSARSVDSALESSAEGIRAVKVSLAGLGVTFVLQLGVAVVSGSAALFADTAHNLADALTAVPLWIAFTLGRRAPTARYTYGYARAEDLAGIAIVVMIAASAALAAYTSIRHLVDPQPIAYLGWVAAAGVIGFAGNELVAVYRIRAGRRIGSAALVADGLHARTDGLTSLAVVVGAAGVALGHPLADPVVGLVITVAILGVLGGAFREIYRRLMDAVDPELSRLATETLRESPDVREVEELRIRWVGHRLRAEATICVDAHLSLVSAHEIADRAHHSLLHGVPRLADATIHVHPDGEHADHHPSTTHHFPTKESCPVDRPP